MEGGSESYDSIGGGYDSYGGYGTMEDMADEGGSGLMAGGPPGGGFLKSEDKHKSKSM